MTKAKGKAGQQGVSRIDGERFSARKQAELRSQETHPRDTALGSNEPMKRPFPQWCDA